MKGMTWRRGLPIAALFAFSMWLGASAAGVTQSHATGTASPGFVRVNQCYRITFSIAGAPNWKVLDVPGDGWLKTEIDAGPASAYREPVWINTAQIVTAREVRCSQ